MRGELAIWGNPDSYAGYNPTGHIIVVTCGRDSDALTRTNWDAAARRLLKACGIESVASLAGDGWWNAPKPDEAPPIYQWEARCSLTGWIRYLMVRPDAPAAVLEEVQEIANDLAGYPALDEDAWSELECEEASKFWAEMSPRDRARVIIDSGSDASIFTARRDYIPSDCGAIESWLR